MREFLIASGEEQMNAAASMFKSYAQWLSIDLSFQHFEEELQQLQQMYAPNVGGIILCRQGNEFIGCVGIRKLTETTAELKRMFVLPDYQGKGIGKELLKQAFFLAKNCGYKSVKLDTLNTMLQAMNFYKKNGFIEIAPYYHNPLSTAVYFEKKTLKILITLVV